MRVLGARRRHAASMEARVMRAGSARSMVTDKAAIPEPDRGNPNRTLTGHGRQNTLVQAHRDQDRRIIIIFIIIWMTWVPGWLPAGRGEAPSDS
jgi:hypothetical protein